MLPATTQRVQQSTPHAINQAIRQQMNERLRYYAQAPPDAIRDRLQQLDHEWDTERALEVNAATVSLIGLTLGATTDRRWFILPAVVATFLLQHGFQGWCPPLPVLRSMGFRTAGEIQTERDALKTLLRRVAIPAESEKSARVEQPQAV